MNAFIKAATTKDAKTWNQAISHSTSGSSLLDYFGKAGSYRGRSQIEVNADMASIFSEDKLSALKIIYYNRLITRKVKGQAGYETEKIQKGQGARDEFIKSLIWLQNNQPELLEKNLHLIPLISSWRDLWYDSVVTGTYFYAPYNSVFELIIVGMTDETQRALIAKYLPRIKSSKHIRTERHARQNKFAKSLCKYLGWNAQKYRQFKSGKNNTAHEFQRVMSQNRWNELNFNTIPGKALFNLIKGKLLQKHNLESKYENWIKSQPVAKFTGYPYELYKAAKSRKNIAQKYTYDRQFDGLVELAKKDVDNEILKRGVLCALDTSSSMSSSYHWGNGIESAVPAPIDICIGLGIYFSKLLQGHFADHVIMFDSNSKFLKLNGDFCDRVDQISKHATAWGSTNFESVIDEIVRVRQHNLNIPIQDYPEILLVVSDMQFNPVIGNVETNYERAMRKLKSVELPPMTIIWWQVNGRFTEDVPNKMDDEGVVMISGFDGAIVTTLLGGKQTIIDEKTGEARKLTPYEKMIEVLNQEILSKITI